MVIHDRSRVCGCAANDFGYEATAEGDKAREDKVAVGIWWELSERWRISDVVQRHGGHDRDDDIVVCEIGIEGRVEWEVVGIIVYCAVDGGVG